MTGDRYLDAKGTATSAFQTSSGPAMPDLGTPEGVIQQFEGLLSSMESPLPAGPILSSLRDMMNGVTGGALSDTIQPIAGIVMQKTLPHLLNDAKLDRKEVIQIISDSANELSQTAADPSAIRQASAALQRLGVRDTDGTLAQGTAKAAVIAAIGVQMMQAQAQPLYMKDEMSSRQTVAVPMNPHR